MKALPVKYRVRFEMCMANEGRIESFREISVSELPCRTLIRSIFVQGLSPSRLEVSSLGLEESLSGLKESPLGLKESPMGLKESPTGLIESPSGLKESPSGLKKSPTGLEASPAGLKEIPARLKENFSWREESYVRLNEKSSKAKDTSLLGLKQIDLREKGALETETLIGETSLKAVVETFSKYVSLNVELESVSKLNVRSNFSESPKLRLTIRIIGKWPKGKQRSREREPSRVPVKNVLQIMKRRKLREKMKRYLRLFTPSSSSLNGLAANFKLWYVNYIYRSNCFFSGYFRIQKVRNSVPRCASHLYNQLHMYLPQKTCWQQKHIVATSNQSVIMICSLFAPGTLPFFVLSFPVLVIKSHHLQKVLGALFRIKAIQKLLLCLIQSILLWKVALQMKAGQQF